MLVLFYYLIKARGYRLKTPKNKQENSLTK